MSKYFGTDGFRGKAGVDLTARHAFLTGRFLGHHYAALHTGDKARIVIGKDTRRSSYMYESALAAGITSPAATPTCSTSPPPPASATSPAPSPSTAAS